MQQIHFCVQKQQNKTNNKKNKEREREGKKKEENFFSQFPVIDFRFLFPLRFFCNVSGERRVRQEKMELIFIGWEN